MNTVSCSLGLSAPTQNIDAVTYREVVGSLHRFRDQLRIRTRGDNRTIPNALSRRTLPHIPFPSSFYQEPEPCREADVTFRILASGVLNILNENRKPRQSSLTRAQWQCFRGIRKLTSNGEIPLSVSDKGGEFVVIPQTVDREITEYHLADSITYRTTEKDFLQQCKRLNHV
ncbi:hypothetical protein Y032_0167g129 [Ancylostoma ceylanicum]|uniref:Uncharacterized protein n=1 Tax=Ancylostoma ceylanicum TaxID=53326 RepID=A0A016SWI5_9BILA|nr:hypothetical protein Y032_0167g129 [Ancylostoma ceylanicum]